MIRDRSRRRAGGDLLVVHVASAADRTDTTPDLASGPVRVGFVVSKAVGNAVVRNRTKRRLRHLMTERLAALDAGTDVVVRALPAAAGADSARLALELDRLLAKAGRSKTSRPKARA